MKKIEKEKPTIRKKLIKRNNFKNIYYFLLLFLVLLVFLIFLIFLVFLIFLIFLIFLVLLVVKKIDLYFCLIYNLYSKL